jgi:hypothetical protein
MLATDGSDDVRTRTDVDRLRVGPHRLRADCVVERAVAVEVPVDGERFAGRTARRRRVEADGEGQRAVDAVGADPGDRARRSVDQTDQCPSGDVDGVHVAVRPGLQIDGGDVGSHWRGRVVVACAVVEHVRRPDGSLHEVGEQQ